MAELPFALHKVHCETDPANRRGAGIPGFLPLTLDPLTPLTLWLYLGCTCSLADTEFDAVPCSMIRPHSLCSSSSSRKSVYIALLSRSAFNLAMMMVPQLRPDSHPWSLIHKYQPNSSHWTFYSIRTQVWETVHWCMMGAVLTPKTLSTDAYGLDHFNKFIINLKYWKWKPHLLGLPYQMSALGRTCPRVTSYWPSGCGVTSNSCPAISAMRAHKCRRLESLLKDKAIMT